MRVIAGQWKGTKLQAGHFVDLRPVTDRIKESVYGTLRERILYANVLDLFAGSGSMGIEALSRGASYVVFVERSEPIGRIMQKNLAKINCAISDYDIILSDVYKVLPDLQARRLKFDLIFSDPPFQRPGATQLLKAISDYELLEKEGILVLRHHKNETVVEQVDQLALVRSKTYGDSVLKYYVIQT